MGMGKDMVTCTCGLATDYEKCCGRYIDQGEAAPNPEALMRSRYTAFTQQNMIYLRETHDPQTRQEFDLQTNTEWAQSVRFTGLEVIHTETQGNKGFVEFKASFQDLKTGLAQTHQELSRFRKQQEKWYFREGKVKE